MTTKKLEIYIAKGSFGLGFSWNFGNGLFTYNNHYFAVLLGCIVIKFNF